MPRLALICLAVASVLPARGVGAQQTPRECPFAKIDTTQWVVTKDPAMGFEMKHPADYDAKRWESRSDTLSGDEFVFRRRAVDRVEFHEMLGFWASAARGPNQSIAPCRIATRSGPLLLYVEHSSRKLSTGRDTIYYVGKAVFTPAGKRQTLVEIGAPDSTGLLEKFTMLRTLRFSNEQ